MNQTHNEMYHIESTSTNDYTTCFIVDQSPEDVFKAITNVRKWWSEDIEGKTDKLGEIFEYHYQDVHFSRFKITELIPNEKIVWKVLDNYFNFTKDKNEWIGNEVIFEISKQENKTKLIFIQKGLVPQYECYEICNNAWNGYVNFSLKSLIETGVGQPNQKEFNNSLVESKSKTNFENYFTRSFKVKKDPEEVFKAITNVRAWWDGTIEGTTDKLGSDFTYSYEDIHYSKQKIVQLIPGKKVVWLVTESKLNFIKDSNEWTGTTIIFEILEKETLTEVIFSHIGLLPDVECYDTCSGKDNFKTIYYKW